MKASVGVALMCAALLAGCGSAATSGLPSQTPTPQTQPPATSTSTAPPGTPSPTGLPTAQATLVPTAPPTPTASPTPDTGGLATRIVISSLKIDLPVVEEPAPPGLPSCNVANRWSANGLFVSPGLPGATYILAYSRPGMFLPLLLASQVNDGRTLIGMKVEVYTSADWRFTYSITAVHRHVATYGSHALDGPRAATSPELWLQTGEDSSGTRILLVSATLVSASPASHAAAQPPPKVVACT